MKKEIKEIVCGTVAAVLLAVVVITIYIFTTIRCIRNAEDISKYLGYNISNDCIVDVDYSYVKSEENTLFTDITVYAILSDDELNDSYFNNSFDSTASNETKIDDDYILSRGRVNKSIETFDHVFIPYYTVSWYRVSDNSQYNVIFHATLPFKAFFSKNIVS